MLYIFVLYVASLILREGLRGLMLTLIHRRRRPYLLRKPYV